MFPIALNYASCILPRRILTGSIGWIVGFGSAGSALFPFMAGAITSKKGIQNLQPLSVIFYYFQFASFINSFCIHVLYFKKKANCDDGKYDCVVGIGSTRATAGRLILTGMIL